MRHLIALAVQYRQLAIGMAATFVCILIAMALIELICRFGEKLFGPKANDKSHHEAPSHSRRH